MKFWHKAASDIFIIIVTASENSGVLTKNTCGVEIGSYIDRCLGVEMWAWLSNVYAN